MGSRLTQFLVQFIKNRCLRLIFLALIVLLVVSMYRIYNWQLETQRSIRCFLLIFLIKVVSTIISHPMLIYQPVFKSIFIAAISSLTYRTFCDF